MASRLAACVPRFIVLAILGLLATATFTFAVVKKPAVVRRPAAVPKKAEPVVKKAKKPLATPRRPPAFRVAGAPKEPLDEIPLTDRAQRLRAWLGRHPKPTAANVRYWLYQNS